jgi:hypothetical protein
MEIYPSGLILMDAGSLTSALPFCTNAAEQAARRFGERRLLALRSAVAMLRRRVAAAALKPASRQIAAGLAG